MTAIDIEELKEKGAFEVTEFKECIDSCTLYEVRARDAKIVRIGGKQC